MNQKEESNRKRYLYCNNIQEREDLIFLYPDEFNKDPNITANTMQKTLDFLKRITGLDPTTFFKQRVGIGYLFLENREEKEGQPRWNPHHNSVVIPWKYLKMPNEPLNVCTHELVHPFYRVSELHEGENEVWGDAFCDFLRGPLKNYIGLDGIDWWKKKIKEAEDRKDTYGGTGAGLLILEAKEIYRGNDFDSYRFIEEFIDDRGNLREFIQRLRKEYSLTPLHHRERFFLTEKMKKRLNEIMRKKDRCG